MMVSFDGVGPVRIGMTAEQVRASVTSALKSQGEEPGSSCYHLEPDVGGLAFMMLKDRLGRVDVHSGRWRTFSGIGIGASEERVRRVHGKRLIVEPHHYGGPVWKYMIVRPEQARYKGLELLYETDGSRVTSFRAGTAEAVALVEGCS
jgi:hypothetical protein